MKSSKNTHSIPQAFSKAAMPAESVEEGLGRETHGISGRAKRWATLALLAAALTSLFFVLRVVVAHPVGTLDFVNVYTAGTILREGSKAKLYSLPLQHEIESHLAPGGQFLPFYHPPFEAWLFLPLALAPYRQAYLLWAAFNLLVLGAVFYLLRYAPVRMDSDSRLVWLATCLPLVTGALVLGQDSLLLALVFLAAYLALKKRCDFVAGLVLGAGLFRFEIVLPFVFIFLLRRQWKLLAGFAVMLAAAISASLAMVGTRGMLEYARIIMEAGHSRGNWMSADVTAMPSLRGAFFTFFGQLIPSVWLFPLILAGTLFLLCWAAWKFSSLSSPEDSAFDLQYSLAVIAALLASYHLFLQEMTPFIIVAYLLLGYEAMVNCERPMRDRPATALLLLFSVTFVVGAVVGFRSFSVLSIILAGLLVWLVREPGLKRGLSASS